MVGSKHAARAVLCTERVFVLTEGSGFACVRARRRGGGCVRAGEGVGGRSRGSQACNAWADAEQCSAVQGGSRVGAAVDG